MALPLVLLLYIVGFVWDMRYISAISFVVVLFGLVLSLYGTKVARSMAFAIGFLVFMIPMPFIDDVAFNLQRLSIHSSGWLLRVMGMPITITGSLISLDDTTFSIGLPCSGLNTLIALLAFAALYVYLLAGSFLQESVPFPVLDPDSDLGQYPQDCLHRFGGPLLRHGFRRGFLP